MKGVEGGSGAVVPASPERRSAGLSRTAALLLAVGMSAAAAAVPAAAQEAPAPEDPSIETRVDAVFAEFDRPGSPGCALAVIREGEVVYERGYGEANLDWGIPITPETVFYSGSVSKQFTAAAVALLVRDGEVGLDDDIREYFPEMPDYGEPVLVRHLIHHTSGIRDIYALMDLAGRRVEDVISDEEALGLIASQTSLNFPPGSDYAYSNAGYFLLGQLVERVTGEPLRVFAAERIFGPLGMEDTHFHDRPGHVIERRAMSYMPADGDGEGEDAFRQSYITNFSFTGQGGLYTTVRDLARWDGSFYTDALDGEGFADLLRTRGVLDSGDTIDYAFGINVTEHRGLPAVLHGGSFMGFKAYLGRFPGEGLSVACLCNLGTIDPGELALEVAEIHLAERFGEAMSGYEGSYRNEDLDIVWEVGVEGGGLRLLRPGAGPGELTWLAPGRFRSPGGWTLVFERGEGDGVTGFTANRGRARGVPFRRVAGVASGRG